MEKPFQNHKLKFSYLKYQSHFAKLSLLEGVFVLLVLISGAVINLLRVDNACVEWPFCFGNIAELAWQTRIHLAHRLMVLTAGLLTTWMLVWTWQVYRRHASILVMQTAVFVLFFSQALLGAILVDGFPLYLVIIHRVTALLVWIIQSIKIIVIGLDWRKLDEISNENIVNNIDRRGFVRDLFLLTKPVVVSLLLITTLAGMVIGAQALPPFLTVFWTLLGGFLAAGGAGAINQYIDRYDDMKMQRTQKRPIPSGRLTPGEGLAFGIGLSLASFYVMAAFVNLLAALLTLAGILYYVIIYSLLLKKVTIQNIVIGGGAGAIPPLVGWAAATGSLNIPSLFLFAIIFFWTPPHFWALALVRKNDYARAGVPMLPVIRGENETRKQVFIYTIDLVFLTLLLPVVGLGGSVYLIGAVILGGWLFHTAWKVWKLGGNKVAWKMYRYSSMYLALLFIVLMVDRLL